MIQPLQQQHTGAQYCSYRVGGPIDEPYLPETVDRAIEVLNLARGKNSSLTILGGGCNTIISSEGIRGVTFISKRLVSIKRVGDHSFKIAAGTPLAKIAALAEAYSLTGAEFFIGVPGTLGGAIIMNAGAMGQETSALVDYIILYDLVSGEVEEWDQNKIKFSYRKSAINPENSIILGAELILKPGNPEEIKRLMHKSLSFRQSHHPKEPNGGSVFKNSSAEMPCGKLLDDLGAKGWREGDAMVSSMHANFIVNTGNATPEDILKLMLRMKRAIKERYGLDVQPENRFLGDATKEEKAIWEELTGHVRTD